MVEITVYEYKKMDIKNAMVVVGFPTVGMVSSIVANFLVTKLDLELIGGIASDELFPAAIVHDGRPAPPIRIYAGDRVCGPKGSCDQIVVISSEFPIDPVVIGPLADTIIGWCRDRGCKFVTAVEGLQTSLDDEELSVYYVGNTEKAREMLSELPVEPMDNGAIGGVSGVLLYKSFTEDLDVGCLLAEARAEFPDSRSAAAILEVLDEMLPLIDVDTSPLLEQAEEIDKQIKTAMEQVQQVQAPDERKPPSGMFR
jgi:uncharacterized protein